MYVRRDSICVAKIPTYIIPLNANFSLSFKQEKFIYLNFTLKIETSTLSEEFLIIKWSSENHRSMNLFKDYGNDIFISIANWIHKRSIKSLPEIWKTVVKAKLQVLSTKQYYRNNDFVLKDVLQRLFKDHGSLKQLGPLSIGELRLSLEITAFIAYNVRYSDFATCITSSAECLMKPAYTMEEEELESMQLFVFIVHLIGNSTPRETIHSLAHLWQSRAQFQDKTSRRIDAYFGYFSKLLGLKLSTFLSLMSSERDVKQLALAEHHEIDEKILDDSDIDLIERTINHPVHLNLESTILPSAFIPFCGFEENMMIPGQIVENFSFPICSNFKVTYLENRLCYELKNEKLKGPGGLFLLFDTNEEKSIQLKTNDSIEVTNQAMNLSMIKKRREGIVVENKILTNGSGVVAYIPLLTPFEQELANYSKIKLSSLQEIETSEKYLKQPFKKRLCGVQMYEECRIEAYVKHVSTDCHCVPFGEGFQYKVKDRDIVL